MYRPVDLSSHSLGDVVIVTLPITTHWGKKRWWVEKNKCIVNQRGHLPRENVPDEMVTSKDPGFQAIHLHCSSHVGRGEVPIINFFILKPYLGRKSKKRNFDKT
jgi:hypothetical protein